MVLKGSEARLKWAFAVALLLHVAALAAAAHLPVPRPATGDLEEIQVFDSSASTLLTPITLVDLPTSSPATRKTRNIQVITSATSAEEQRGETPRLQPALRTPRAAAPVRSGRNASASPEPRGAEASARPGGGGGGPLDLGSASPNGAVSVPATGEGGGTEMGRVPGEGSGRGSGEGSGSGSGSGTGAGRGEGAGVGNGKGGGSGENAEPGFASRLADRAEPEVVRKGRLVYPEAAIADGVEGTCVLKVLVSEAGDVLEVEITRSSGDRRLDRAAREFVQQWRYRPAVQDGKPRRVNTRATVQFELN